MTFFLLFFFLPDSQIEYYYRHIVKPFSSQVNPQEAVKMESNLSSLVVFQGVYFLVPFLLPAVNFAHKDPHLFPRHKTQLLQLLLKLIRTSTQKGFE